MGKAPRNNGKAGEANKKRMRMEDVGFCENEGGKSRGRKGWIVRRPHSALWGTLSVFLFVMEVQKSVLFLKLEKEDEKETGITVCPLLPLLKFSCSDPRNKEMGRGKKKHQLNQK